jgi:hypothetical protein
VHVQRSARRPWQKFPKGRAEHVGLERVTKRTSPQSVFVVNLVPRLILQEVQTTHLSSILTVTIDVPISPS